MKEREAGCGGDAGWREVETAGEEGGRAGPRQPKEGQVWQRSNPLAAEPVVLLISF
jgi:hypothetical protein